MLTKEEIEYKAVWTAEMQEAARLEGWFLVHCQGSKISLWQIQKIDDPGDNKIEGKPDAPELGSDQDAWRIVVDGTGQHHKVALDFLKKHAPAEYEEIKGFKCK